MTTNTNPWRSEEDPTNPPLSTADSLYIAGILLLMAVATAVVLHMVLTI